MEDMPLQSLQSALRPPEGVALGGYLDAVERALGLQSDAALARVMGHPATAIANWRRRGTVSRDAERWFEASLLDRLARRHDYPFEAGSFEVNAVLELLRRTGVDPLRAGIGANQMTGELVPPMLALASVVIAGQRAADLDRAVDGGTADSELADLLSEALPRFRRIIAPGLREGPQ